MSNNILMQVFFVQRFSKVWKSVGDMKCIIYKFEISFSIVHSHSVCLLFMGVRG